MQLECFPTIADPPEMVPGRPDRAWMDGFAGRSPYRCLPLTMANTSGWELLCPTGFTAEWNGGQAAADLKVIPDVTGADLGHLVRSHFAYGTLTFHTGYLFRTPPGWAVQVSGPPNGAKHGIQALSGLVETDWLPFPFTMNWLFTAPGRVRFEKGEPFCFIQVVEDRKLERIEPVIRKLDSEPELKDQYEVWSRLRAEFNEKLDARDPEALKASWQRFYFKGAPPERGGPAPEAHINRRRLKKPEVE
ncbi:MAG: hypothetical protein JSR98_08340 [Proteobacteria bacterium]|nr:hypothetical protein [Pseudomonadota bacterium]